ncbi:MAG: MerC domain-containing protein [Candidatus Melainabacteria bacterium]|nr:MerC domain-containing protein [Candidatus Melainabacteria bacterium]
MATSIGARKKSRWKSLLDFLAVAGPIICLIDCVVLPVMSALLPFLGHTDIAHGINDQAIVCLVLAICLPIIIPGYLKHRSNRVLGMFAAAITIMMVVNFSGIELGEMTHGAISIVTAFLLIKANRENKKLLAGCACSFHTGAEHKPAAEPVLATTAIGGFQQVLFAGAETAPQAHAHSHHHEHGGSCGHDHSHDHVHAGPTVQDVVNALELKEHLEPNHFEPRNNLNFEPPVVAAAPAPVEQHHQQQMTVAQMSITSPFPAVSYCG